MTDIAGLLRRLEKGGIPISQAIKEAMMSVDIEDFTDYDTEVFYVDRPVPFMETEQGAIKTISAPHMVATLLHHMELKAGEEVVILGAKGGYIAALVARILGSEGAVRVLDPSMDAVLHVRSRLTHWPTVEARELESVDVAPVAFPGEIHRVLITGQLTAPPTWMTERLVEGGFILAPIGTKASQQLVKIERQGEELMPTELGPVAFGPVDVRNAEPGPMNADELADLLELAIQTCEDLELIEDEERYALEDLVVNLRNLPDDLPPPGEGGLPMEQHPMIQLMWQAAPSFFRLWPMLQTMIHPNLAQPGAPDWDDEEDDSSDFQP
ncbi:protein-L-isoaspartate O-methyltransferase [Euryarchaeota archaeon]|jgi:protein-L-isoaspartate(D-aspartate) O-methyltransferase|nr:protein-L-isoaspartate O-methyltransferase [Euryarchaeota archaeon]|tara:strand:- start:2404 stop:3378 length:975 start_codon:yes stop_codon:yes gene_type:complete